MKQCMDSDNLHRRLKKIEKDYRTGTGNRPDDR